MNRTKIIMVKSFFSALMLFGVIPVFGQEAARSEMKSSLDESSAFVASVNSGIAVLSASQNPQQAKQAMEEIRKNIDQAIRSMSDLEKKVDAMVPLSSEDNSTKQIQRKMKRFILAFQHQMTTAESRIMEMERSTVLFVEGRLQRYVRDIVSSVREAEDEMNKLRILAVN